MRPFSVRSSNIGVARSPSAHVTGACPLSRDCCHVAARWQGVRHSPLLDATSGGGDGGAAPRGGARVGSRMRDPFFKSGSASIHVGLARIEALYDRDVRQGSE